MTYTEFQMRIARVCVEYTTPGADKISPEEAVAVLISAAVVIARRIEGMDALTFGDVAASSYNGGDKDRVMS